MMPINRRGESLSSVALWWSCLSLLAAVGLVQAQEITFPNLLTSTTTTTALPTTTTTPPPITTTTTTITTTTVPITTTTTAFTSIISTPSTTPSSSIIISQPVTSTFSRTSSQSIIPIPSPTIPTSKNSTDSKVPIIVGSIAGAAAVIIIVATTVICFRRRRRNNHELPFDTLQGISTTDASSRQRTSQRFNNGAGRTSVTTSGFDDGFDYESQSNMGHAGQMGYGDNGYDPYGTSQHSYQNPSIFQEDSLAYAGAMGRNRAGYDQHLPEIMYRNGNDLNSPVGDVTGYYDDSMYNQQAGWNPDGGHSEPKGLWVANPTAEKSQQLSDNQYAIELQQPRMSLEMNSLNQHDNSSDTVVGSSSPRSKFHGHNPQVLPESPRTHQLRGGDLFGEDANQASSPRSAAAQPETSSGQDATPSSPREMRSFERSRNSPPRPSGEGAQSYAADYAARRPSASERPSMEMGPSKSLRTQRRDDWS